MKTANQIFENPVFAQTVTALMLARNEAHESKDVPLALHYESMANSLVAGMHTATTLDINFDEHKSPLVEIDRYQDLCGCLTRHIESHATLGKPWPSSAEFCVVYRLSTWPVGWSKEKHITFFNSRDDLQLWIDDKHDWAKAEDNYVAYQAYEWDLGPLAMDDLCSCTQYLKG